MAKSKNIPLKDEPLDQYDDLCNKMDDLVQVINKQNEYLRSIAQHGGYDSEFNFINNEFNVRKTMENALDEYLQKKNLQIEKPGENNLLTEAKQVLQEYMDALGDATEAHKRYAETRNKLANNETHHDESVQSSVSVQHPQKPRSVKKLFAYLFYRLPLYYIRKFFPSQYVRWTLRVILFSVWFISICLTCIIAHDNAKLHTIQKKYVLLRECARPNHEWADTADYIEFLYTDESEHQGEIEVLWENRRKRPAK